MSRQSGGVREGAGDDQGGQEQQYSSGVQEGARDDRRGEKRQDSAGSVHVFRGPMHDTVMGSQTVVKNVNKTFMPVGSFGQTSEPGKFEVGARIVVLENQPISISSRVFHAKLHSDVTGIKEIVVKITPDDVKHQREAKIHFSVPHHKNIVERILTDVFNFRGQSSIYIAMERCDCNLYDHIKSQVREGIPFEPQKYLSIVHQVVVGLDFLHSHNVVHGDLKPSNVLLMLDGNLVKLSDFGLSRAISDDKTSTQLTSPQGGTAGWLAPEILEGTTRIAPENDIFPLGLVCNFAWSYGKHPYGDQPLSWNHYILEGTNLNLDRMLIPNADSAKDLLTSMLLRDPADRPTAKQVLKHHIFASQVLNRSNQVNDAQVTEVLEKAFRAMSCTGGSEEQSIGPDGGSIDHLGCKISFPPMAVERATDFATSVITDFSDSPEGMTPIAPILECVLDGSLKALVQIEMCSWACSEVQGHLYRKDEGSNWEFIDVMTLTPEAKISFTTQHFTWFGVFVRTLLGWPLATKIYLHIHRDGGVAFVCCLSHPKILQDVESMLKKGEFIHPLLMPEPVAARSDAKLSVGFECQEPSALSIRDADNTAKQKCERNVEVADVVTNTYQIEYFPLEISNGRLKEYKDRLRMSLTITNANGKSIIRPIVKEWPPMERAAPGAAAVAAFNYVAPGGRMSNN